MKNKNKKKPGLYFKTAEVTSSGKLSGWLLGSPSEGFLPNRRTLTSSETLWANDFAPCC